MLCHAVLYLTRCLQDCKIDQFVAEYLKRMLLFFCLYWEQQRKKIRERVGTSIGIRGKALWKRAFALMVVEDIQRNLLLWCPVLSWSGVLEIKISVGNLRIQPLNHQCARAVFLSLLTWSVCEMPWNAGKCILVYAVRVRYTHFNPLSKHVMCSALFLFSAFFWVTRWWYT